MGRLMGFEPMHIGTTIRGLNRLTTGATSLTSLSISNKDLKSSSINLIIEIIKQHKGRFAYANRPLLKIFCSLAYTLKHVSNSSSGQD